MPPANPPGSSGGSVAAPQRTSRLLDEALQPAPLGLHLRQERAFQFGLVGKLADNNSA